eukprot:9881580-Heterocapsa_arctica.AAC.1
MSLAHGECLYCLSRSFPSMQPTIAWRSYRLRPQYRTDHGMLPRSREKTTERAMRDYIIARRKADSHRNLSSYVRAKTKEG